MQSIRQLFCSRRSGNIAHVMQKARMLNRLKELREGAGLTLEQVAERMGLSVSQVSRLERGKSDPTLSRLRDFATLYGVRVQDIINHTIPVSSIMVRGAVQAGVWVEALEWPRDDWYAVSVVISKEYEGVPKFGLEVRGPSMDLLYPPGSVAICVSVIHLTKPIPPGKRVVVEREDGNGLIEATVKEYAVDDEGRHWLLPRSSKPEFQQPIKVDENAKITALVIGSYRPE